MDNPQGKIITVFSTKGGVGKTTLAVNVALDMALRKKKIVLIDCDLQAPEDIAKMLNFEAEYSLIDIARNIENIKTSDNLSQFLNAYTKADLYFLPALKKISSSSGLNPDDVFNVLGLLREKFEYIVVDAGKMFSEIFLKIMDNTNLLFLVVTPDILSVYQTQWMLEVLQNLGYPQDMVNIILNRTESKGSVTLQEMKLLLASPILAQIPSDGKNVNFALNRAIPAIIDVPKARFSMAVSSLVTVLLENQELYMKTETLQQIAEKHREKMSSPAEFWEQTKLSEAPQVTELHFMDEILELKRKVHQQLVDEMNIRQLPIESITIDRQKNKELREKAEKIAANILAKETTSLISSYESRKRIIKEIVDEALGLGPLEDLLADPDITEIMVNNKSQVYIERNGVIMLTDKKFTSNDQVRVIIERIIAPLGRRIDESVPMVDARLPDGSRVNAVISPVSLTGPTLTIRRFRHERHNMVDLIETLGSLTPNMASFLESCVLARKNMIVSGGTGSGKTTLLNILSAYIPESERIVTIEDAAELKLHQSHWVRMESRPPNIEGKGELTVRELFINSLRMRPDRIIVGECRGKEVLDMLQAMNTGHDGSMTTVHANSPHDVMTRLDSMILMSGIELPIRAIREMITSAIDVIVHTHRLSDGTRKVSQITEIAGLIDDTHVSLRDIFVFKQRGIGDKGKVEGAFGPTGYIPSFFDEFKAKGIKISENLFLPED